VASQGGGPISWLVQRDVDEGRRALNLSTGEVAVEEMIESIREGSMPPWQYKPTHAGARLSEQEKQDLTRGLEATFGAGGAVSGENEEGEGG
jgi:heme-binding protein